MGASSSSLNNTISCDNCCSSQIRRKNSKLSSKFKTSKDICCNQCGHHQISQNKKQQEDNSPKSYKLVTLGSSGVGKTSISFRFVSNIFITEYDPTVEDAYKKDYFFDGKETKLELIDTAGQEEYSSGVHDKSIRCGDGFILVFSITSRESFLKIKELKKKIQWVKDNERKIPMIMVGNKSDIEKDRKVTKNEARTLADELGCRYIETSAKTNENIELVFNSLLALIVEKKNDNINNNNNNNNTTIKK